MNSKGETARQSYIAARNEILLRMKLRDQMLLFYLAAIGTLLGIALGTSNSPEILLVIPLIALGTSIIVSQHNVVMAVLGQFCAEELGRFFKNLDPSENSPQWDNSKTYKSFSANSTNLRSLSHITIILVPSFLALMINWKHINSPFPLNLIWYIGVACFIFSFVIILKSHTARSNFFQNRDWSGESTY